MKIIDISWPISKATTGYKDRYIVNVDEIETKKLPLFSYAKGSIGPQEEKQFTDKHGMRWRS